MNYTSSRAHQMRWVHAKSRKKSAETGHHGLHRACCACSKGPDWLAALHSYTSERAGPANERGGHLAFPTYAIDGMIITSIEHLNPEVPSHRLKVKPESQTSAPAAIGHRPGCKAAIEKRRVLMFGTTKQSAQLGSFG